LGVYLLGSSFPAVTIQAETVLLSTLGIDVIAITLWNDAPNRTVDEVLAALDRAAIAAAPGFYETARPSFWRRFFRRGL
jgi:hypothetical protein